MLHQRATDNARAHQDLSFSSWLDGLDIAALTMKHLEEEEQRGVSEGYGASGRKLRRGANKDRVIERTNKSAHRA